MKKRENLAITAHVLLKQNEDYVAFHGSNQSYAGVLWGNKRTVIP